MIVASAELRPPLWIEDNFLEDEAGVDERLDRGNKCLLAQRGKIAPLRLIANCALERPDLFVPDFDAPVVALVLEFRPDERSLELRVLIIGNADAEADRLDALQRLEKRAAQVPAPLLHVDRHVGLGDCAVVCVEPGVGEADEPVIPHIRAAG